MSIVISICIVKVLGIDFQILLIIRYVKFNLINSHKFMKDDKDVEERKETAMEKDIRKAK